MAGPKSSSGRSKSWLERVTRRMLRMSLRLRLMAAFSFLIISSASVTIFIGHTVFSQKVVEVMAKKVIGDLAIAADTLELVEERLELRAMALALTMEAPTEPDWSTVCGAPGPRPDFVVVHGADHTVVYGSVCSPSPMSAPGSTDEVVPFAHEVSLEGTPLMPLLSGTHEAGLLVVDAATIELLEIEAKQGESLVMVATAPRPDGELVLVGVTLDHAEAVTEAITGMFESEGEGSHGVSFFLGGTRVMTTIDNEAVGKEVGPEVIEAVLERGEIYQGLTEIEGRTFATAYAPLVGVDGGRIGMLGIGIEEAIYGQVTRATTALFASLIVAGMIFGLAMSFIFSSWLIRPIVELAVGMSRVARGDLHYKVRIDSSDELGSLAKAFNMMVRAVKERDLKLREMTEERLSQVEKQVSIGRLAAGVAHEINNPLTAVLSLSSLLLKHADQGSRDEEDLEIIVAETTRCREIVRGLLNFARESPTEKREVEINRVIEQTLALTRTYDALDGVTVTTDLGEGSHLVSADSKQLQQVITNVVINAAEAMGNKGAITISTDDDSSGGFVVIKVRDTGPGIPDEHLKRVFEPFFTTKGAKKGTGLGLSVSLGIVQKHGGAIEIESEEDHGTTVTIILPRIDAAQEGA